MRALSHAKHILRYQKTTAHQVLRFAGTALDLACLFDQLFDFNSRLVIFYISFSFLFGLAFCSSSSSMG
jgi:hypothetical protein